ncbi:MAG TPA: hypothetical protein VIL88_12650 [Devosia sp.]|jgi:hypothetical protein|uniref:hypothetical protein n=1 Tax=Devosia sp. TaxID=1871048 RepID=UPI002F9593BC
MISIDNVLLAAREEFYDRADAHPEFIHYVCHHGLELGRISGFAGAMGIVPVVDCGSGRFDFDAPSEMIQAFICEAYAEDGETVIDLVAWPVDRPKHVMTMFGRAPILGLWEAFNPASYYGGKPLQMHRTPLEWLKAGCRGAAVVRPVLAARLLFELEGAVAAADQRHAQELHQIISMVIPKGKVVVPRAA